MTPQDSLKRIANQYQALKDISLKKLFAEDENRGQYFSLTCDNIFFDYSKNLLNKAAISELLKLAEGLALKKEIKWMFDGEIINKTEQRAVLHTALRDFSDTPIYCGGENVKPQVKVVYQNMIAFANKVYNQQWLGSSGQPINHIINIGIGGSDLGPKMAARALRSFTNRQLSVDFVSNVDPAELEEALAKIDPARVLFIVASKTFTTEETMLNAHSAKAWLKDKLGQQAEVKKQFIALSTNVSAAREFGIAEELIFPFWDWVGGRFSLASAIGMALMVIIGPKNFSKMLSGMRHIDIHFQQAPLAQNLPIILALIGYWYANFWRFPTVAILPYSSDLALLPKYLQQLEMESNGKGVDRQGKRVDYPTAPVIWGAAGTDGQHSFYQLLHQGTAVVPCDFIGFRKTNRKPLKAHNVLMSHFFAQQQALAFGAPDSDLLNYEGISPLVRPYKDFPGNRPSNCLLFDELNPFSLGQLIAIYEHKVFVQGILWNIFSFDQWGVELGKLLAGRIQKAFKNKDLLNTMDSSTSFLIRKYLDK